MSLFIGAVVVNTNDMDRAIAFWTRALGYEVSQNERDFVVLHSPDGTGPRLSLQVTNEPKLGVNRLHLDLFTPDQAGEIERLESLGARRIEWDYPDDADFVVMADPDENEFCVIETSKGPNE